MNFPKELGRMWYIVCRIAKYITVPAFALLLASRVAYAGSGSIVSQLNGIQHILMQAAPALSAVLFVLAGIFYALGQMLPPEKKAHFHTAAVNIIIGAIVVGALSVASTSLAITSTHLIGNLTVNSTI
jgi:hypothetical protein